MRLKTQNIDSLTALNRRIFGILFIILISFAAFAVMILSEDLGCSSHGDTLEIKPGATVQDVAADLALRHCISSASVLKLALRITLNDKQIKAGRYQLSNVRTVFDLVQLITSGEAEQTRITILEGWTLTQIAEEAENQLGLDARTFLERCQDPDFIASLGIEASTLEGFLFPDTYLMLSTFTVDDVVRTMTRHFQSVFQRDVWKNGCKLSQLEIVTLASIIQGECMYSDEMSRVASVYQNRLTKKMKLQADPTIQYILPKRKKRLYDKDLEIDSPYNTYMYAGLPPGPINSPGKAALQAVVTPEVTDYLYFVADGSGRHVFTRTNDEHINAKNKIRRKKR